MEHAEGFGDDSPPVGVDLVFLIRRARRLTRRNAGGRLQPRPEGETEMTTMNANPERKATYSVVVESGSCSQDYQRWEERAHCGHDHRTVGAAKACLAKLTRRYCNHGRVAGTSCRHCSGYAQGHATSARWYNATIHNQDSERVDR